MRKVVSAVVALGLAGAAAGGVHLTSAQAAPHSADLVVTGSVAGGLRSLAQPGHPVVFVFTLTNKGPSRVASGDMQYTSVVNGTVVDQLCIMPNGTGINPDSPACEPGGLAVRQSSRMTLSVLPVEDATGTRLSVRVCGYTEDATPDPVTSNSCTTSSVAIG